nr:hypothetical protein [Entomoplasma sp. MP1]
MIGTGLAEGKQLFKLCLPGVLSVSKNEVFHMGPIAFVLYVIFGMKQTIMRN